MVARRPKPLMMLAPALLLLLPGCKSNVGTLEVEVLVSPDPTERPLRGFASDVRVSVSDGDGVLASGVFPVGDSGGALAGVPVGDRRQVLVEGLDPEARVVSRGRTVPLSITSGTNRVALYVGRLNAFSLTPGAPTRATTSTDASPDDSSLKDGGAADGDAAPPADGRAGDAQLADAQLADTQLADTQLADTLAPDTSRDATPLEGGAPVDDHGSGMVTARAFHQATPLKDGTMIVSGGAVDTVWRPGATEAPTATRSVELLDQSALRFLPADGGCEATGASCLQRARVGHTATPLSSGNVLVAGGSDGGNLVSQVEIFDLAKRGFFFGPALVTERTGHAAAATGGQVALVGGRGRSTALASVERYDREIREAPQMRDARQDFALVTLRDGTLLAIGGFDRRGAPLRSTEFLKPGAPSWTSGPRLQVGRAHLQAVHLEEQDAVLIVGGLTARTAGACAQRDAAGCVGATAVELLDGLSTSETERVGELNLGRWAHSATRLSDGRVMVVGGFAPNIGGAPAASTEEIRISEGQLFQIKQGRSMRRPRAGHSATLLGSGFLLVVGGVSVDRQVLSLEASAEVFIY